MLRLNVFACIRNVNYTLIFLDVFEMCQIACVQILTVWQIQLIVSLDFLCVFVCNCIKKVIQFRKVWRICCFFCKPCTKCKSILRTAYAAGCCISNNAWGLVWLGTTGWKKLINFCSYVRIQFWNMYYIASCWIYCWWAWMESCVLLHWLVKTTTEWDLQ